MIILSSLLCTDHFTLQHMQQCEKLLEGYVISYFVSQIIYVCIVPWCDSPEYVHLTPHTKLNS